MQGEFRCESVSFSVVIIIYHLYCLFCLHTGELDWAHAGANTDTDIDRKAKYVAGLEVL